MFEHYSKPLISRQRYYLRVVSNFIWACAILFFSLLIGVLGYHFIASLSWIDSFLNASMILTGMGPVNQMYDTASKLFSGLYAIYSGVAFLSTIAVFMAPVIHRFMHRFHLTDEMEKEL